MPPRPHIFLAVLLVLSLAEARAGIGIVATVDGDFQDGPDSFYPFSGGTLAAAPCIMPPYSPYSSFDSLSLSDLARTQLKLTYMGFIQVPRVPTTVLTAGGIYDGPLFRKFRRPGYAYSNDILGVSAGTVSPGEMEAVIDSIGGLSGVTDGEVDSLGVLSFSLLCSTDDTILCFESIVDDENARNLFAKMLPVFLESQGAAGLVNGMACEIGYSRSLEKPKEVTETAEVQVGGMRLDRETGHFVSVLEVKNNSGAVFPPPVLVMLDSLPQLVGVEEAGGLTCGIEPPGAPYVVVSASSGLGPGETVQMVLRFWNPSGDRIRVAPRVFCGPGAR